MAFSKGCEGCRASKTRCDVARPACGRCVRTGRPCRYRDLSDIHFRDQTKQVMAKQGDDLSGGDINHNNGRRQVRLRTVVSDIRFRDQTELVKLKQAKAAAATSGTTGASGVSGDYGRKQKGTGTGTEKKESTGMLLPRARQSNVGAVADPSSLARSSPTGVLQSFPGNLCIDGLTCFFAMYPIWSTTLFTSCSPLDLNYTDKMLPLGRRAMAAAAAALGKVTLANSQHAGKDSALRIGSLKDNMAALRLLRQAVVSDSDDVRRGGPPSGHPSGGAREDQLRHKSDSDAMITAVHFLSLFELVLSPNDDAQNGWCSHLSGVQAMLERRIKAGSGNDEKTQLTPPLYTHHGWQSQQAVRALMSYQPVPPSVVAMHRWILETTVDRSEWLSARLCLAMCHLATLQHRAASGAATDDDILAEAVAVAADLDSWRQVLPSAEFGYDLVVGDKKTYTIGRGLPLVPYRGCWHRYRQFVHSCMWNDYRTAMQLLLKLMFEHGGFQPELAILRDELQVDVCLSVPQMLGIVDFADGEKGGYARTFSLLWSLWVVCESSIGDRERTDWLDGCLLAIGRGLGIYTALSVRDYLISATAAWDAAKVVERDVHEGDIHEGHVCVGSVDGVDSSPASFDSSDPSLKYSLPSSTPAGHTT